MRRKHVQEVTSVSARVASIERSNWWFDADKHWHCTARSMLPRSGCGAMLVNSDVRLHYQLFGTPRVNNYVSPCGHPWRLDVLADYARLVELLTEHGPSLRLPHSRAFGDGLFELRPRGRSGIGRAFYCFLIGKRVVVLHAFIKKSQQTPDKELNMARKRLKEVMHG